MLKNVAALPLLLAMFAGSGVSCLVAAAAEASPLADPNFFPVAVWLQNPSKAPQYKAAGINLYVGLWRGPTEEQLAELKRHGMRVICGQNAVGLAHKDDPTIVGWMHGDEPDNAQSLRGGKGYGPPILPAKIVEDYDRLKEADPSRPVLLNLGQGVAWDHWHRPRRAAATTPRTTPSTSRAATSPRSTSTRPATTSRTWPASCGSWPTA